MDRLPKVVARLGPDVEEDIMTTADMLRAEGRAEGEAKGRVETLTQLLMQKFGPPAGLGRRQAARRLDRTAGGLDRAGAQRYHPRRDLRLIDQSAAGSYRISDMLGLVASVALVGRDESPQYFVSLAVSPASSSGRIAGVSRS